MTKECLKAGMVVELQDDNNVTFCMVTCNSSDELVISGEASWFPVKNLNKGLSYNNTKILKIYSRACAKYAWMLDTTERKLLWSRPTEVELTMQEIADKFGISVEQLKIKK